MSFQTLTPQFSPASKPLLKGQAVIRHATANDEVAAHFDINVGWEKWALVSSFSSHDFGDLRMGRHGPDDYLRPFYVQRIDGKDLIVANEDPLLQRPSGYSQINMMQKVRFQPSDNWDLQYAFHYSETSSYARYDRHIRYRPNGMPRDGEWSYGPQIWMMNYFSASHNGKNAAYDQMHLRLAQQAFEESRISRGFNSNNRATRIENVNALSANLDFQKTLGARHTLFYGVEAVQNFVTSTGIDEDISTGEKEPGPARYPQATWASYAVYLSEQFKVSEKFLIQAGARYSQYQLHAEFDTTFYPFPFSEADLNAGSLSGSLGFVFRPTPKWALSLNASSGFRAPNVDDVGKVFDSEPGAVVVPNPNLRAEQAYNLEAGLARIIGENVKLEFSVYYTLLENAMVRRNFSLNDQDSIWYDGELSRVQAIQNAASAQVYGVQAGLEFKLPQGFSLSTDFNYQKGEEELDDGSRSPSRHAPPWFGMSRLSWTSGKASLQFNAVYSGAVAFADLPVEERGKPELYAKDADGNPWSPAWYTLNFKAMYAFAEHFSVSAGLENITDQRYRTYSSGIAAAGRNFILSLRANF
jgi:hemoglobin/transferrin/lactoferrin receptor protein